MKKNLELEEDLKLLKESLEDLELYIDQFRFFLPIAVCDVTVQGLILSINRAFQKLTGYKEIEVIGKPIEFLFLEKDKVREVLSNPPQKEKIKKKELTLASKIIPVRVFIGERKDSEGKTLGFFWAIIDISDFKNLEKKLQNLVEEKTKELQIKIKELDETSRALMNILEDVEEARNRAEEEKNKTLAIIENFSDGLLVFDNLDRLILINSRAKEFLGLFDKKLINLSIKELEKIPELTDFISLLKKQLINGKKGEFSPRENLNLSIATIPLIRDEKKGGTIVVIHDITREKIIEKMKTEFVSIAAHQLRTPLSAIKWTLKMLLDGDLGPLTKDQKDFIEKTYKSNERMINLINDLLNVSRIEEGRYLYRVTPIEFKELVQSVIDLYKEEARKKNIELEYEKTDKESSVIEADIEKLKLAVSNLIENAIKYTKNFGKIFISVKNKGENVEFLIKDTGVGIPKSEQQRVFSKFFRGSNVLRLETEGSGLGLFIVKNIIETHKGKIWFESEENKGTTFVFELPRKKD